jgi:hypothetical protein
MVTHVRPPSERPRISIGDRVLGVTSVARRRDNRPEDPVFARGVELAEVIHAASLPAKRVPHLINAQRRSPIYRRPEPIQASQPAAVSASWFWQATVVGD